MFFNFFSLLQSCSGLTNLNLQKNPNISDKSILSLKRSCAGIREIDVRGCPSVGKDAIAAIRAVRGRVKVFSDFSN